MLIESATLSSAAQDFAANSMKKRIIRTLKRCLMRWRFLPRGARAAQETRVAAGSIQRLLEEVCPEES